jgi:hypothetical protein
MMALLSAWEKNREENVSAALPAQETHAWISGTDGDEEWSGGAECASSEGSPQDCDLRRCVLLLGDGQPSGGTVQGP